MQCSSLSSLLGSIGMDYLKRELYNKGKILRMSYMTACRPSVKSVYQKCIFLISQPKHMLWVLRRTVSMRRSFEHQKHMLNLMGKKIFVILR